MTSHTTQSFRDRLAKLPKNIRAQARAAYRRFQADPNHKGLHFKKVHNSGPVYSARINDDYRFVGILEGSEIVWFWIGKHEEYERLLKQL